MNKMFWSETDLAIHGTALGAARARRPSCSTTTAGRRRGSTASSSPWPGRSTPAPTRSSATWWPSACSGCPGPERTATTGRPVHFAFDEDQLEFRAQLRAFADKQCTPADIREAWASPLGWSRPRWAALAEMGVVGLTVPEEYGGMGLGLVDARAAAGGGGRAGLPEPLRRDGRARGPGPGRRAGPAGRRRCGRAGWRRWPTAERPWRWGCRRCPPFPVPRGRPLAARARRRAARRARRRGGAHAPARARRVAAPGPGRLGAVRRRRWSCRVSKPRRSSPRWATGRRWAPGRCWWAWPTG